MQRHRRGQGSRIFQILFSVLLKWGLKLRVSFTMKVFLSAVQINEFLVIIQVPCVYSVLKHRSP